VVYFFFLVIKMPSLSPKMEFEVRPTAWVKRSLSFPLLGGQLVLQPLMGLTPESFLSHGQDLTATWDFELYAFPCSLALILFVALWFPGKQLNTSPENNRVRRVLNSEIGISLIYSKMEFLVRVIQKSISFAKKGINTWITKETPYHPTLRDSRGHTLFLVNKVSFPVLRPTSG